jgi:hypothetical protein
LRPHITYCRLKKALRETEPGEYKSAGRGCGEQHSNTLLTREFGISFNASIRVVHQRFTISTKIAAAEACWEELNNERLPKCYVQRDLLYHRNKLKNWGIPVHFIIYSPVRYDACHKGDEVEGG